MELLNQLNVKVAIICAIVSALAVLLPAQQLIHIFQLESYKRPQFYMRLKEDPALRRSRMKASLASFLIQVLIILVITFTFPRFFDLMYYYSFSASVLSIVVIFYVTLIFSYIKYKRQPSKKPLKITARVVRLDISLAVVSALLNIIVTILCMSSAIILLLLVPESDEGESSPMYVAFSIAVLVTPYLGLILSQFLTVTFLPRLLAFASILVQPIENAVKDWYFNDARKKLAGFTGMVKVGITGSYGKTSAKVILATILSEKYKTYATPHSYNTPMGVTRAIREQLDDSYQVFIAEMGARHVGDIAEMCSLVHPKYGLLTSVGPQHLETFFTIENVAKTKYELIDALPADGMAFFPRDNEICLELYRETDKPKALFGFEDGSEPLYMSAKEITHGPEGSTFVLTGPDGAFVKCTTRLLGRHNVQNILGCAAVAHALGLTLEEIARGIGKAEPVEHRLQLIPTTNGITVIDDAFNSNPAGARAALDVLKDFPGRKIIITPGLVELGDAEAAENEAFGREMASAVDIAILVARNAEDMKRGLLEAGFDEDNLIVTGKLAQASAALGSLGRPGDVVLFENDLPDHYET
jgi:UDP-N-acetylmuramoyl-tripeptide--D-alanyl-D-alanine ligase